MQGLSRDPTVVPIRRSDAADGAQTTEVPEVGLKVVEEEAGAAKAIGQPYLAEVQNRDATPAMAPTGYPDAIEGPHPLEDGRRPGVEVEERCIGETRRP